MSNKISKTKRMPKPKMPSNATPVTNSYKYLELLEAQKKNANIQCIAISLNPAVFNEFQSKGLLKKMPMEDYELLMNNMLFVCNELQK